MRASVVIWMSVAVVATAAAAGPDVLPHGWHANCGDVQTGCRGVYHYGIDDVHPYTGSSSATLSSDSAAPAFGGLQQTIKADAFRGRRLRFSAGLRTEHVEGWTGLWLRIVNADRKVVAFDNMQRLKRSLHGDNAWSDQSVVLDVPDDAAAITFGVVLAGPGQVSIGGARLEVVGRDVAVTGGEPGMLLFAPIDPRTGLKTAQNLDFER